MTTLLARPAQTGDAFGLVNPLIASGKFTASALSLAPVTPSGGTVTGYATGQDPATLLASSFAAIPAAVGNYNVGGTAGMLTARASSAISSSVAAGSYLAGSINTVAHTQTIIYYLPGTTLAAMNAGTATVINTALLTLDTTNTKIQSRVNTPGTF